MANFSILTISSIIPRQLKFLYAGRFRKGKPVLYIFEMQPIPVICFSYVPLPKSTQEERIASNANVYGFELSGADMAALDALDEGSSGAISWNPVNAA